MLGLVKWIESVEWLANGLYEDAAAHFRDGPLGEFLDRLARDEAWHAQLMADAAGFIQTHPEANIVAAVNLNDQARARVEAPFRKAADSLARGELSGRGMIEYMVEVEFSEWNTMFVYAVNTLKSYGRQFEYGAAAIEAHKQRIEEFLDAAPAELKLSRDICALPRLWQTRFLVVDDEEPLRDLLGRVLSRRGVVETACNGAEALAMIREKFYNVVVADVNMPVMDGLKLYRRVIDCDDGARPQFLFYTGALTRETGEFVRAHDLPYLLKPFTLDRLMKLIDAILEAFPEPMR